MTGTVLRLRADAYYVPVPNGVWIRTTDGSFTLNGKTVATWVEKLAPLLDRGVVPDELLGALKPEQAAFVDKLLKALEQRKVLRPEPADEGADDPESARLFPQQAEYLRHFTARPAEGFARVRRHPLAVAGPAERVGPLATTLMETGFGDLVLLDTAPGKELQELAEDFGRQGAPVRLSGPDGDLEGRTVIGVFAPGEEEDAWRLLDRAEALGSGAWAALVRGQAMLLKGQVPRSGRACVRCAWRRLAHQAVELPPSDGLGYVPVSVAATVLAQEVFQYVAGGDDAVLGEGVVVDLTRLSIWRTDVDPDPDCPGHALPAGPADPSLAPAAGRRTRFPDSVFGARCFGPLFSCTPEQLPQFPLTALRLRINPPGRGEPTGSADGPVIVAESVADARAEAAVTAVEATLPTSGDTVVGVGKDRAEAGARALLRWADAALDDAAPDDAGAERREGTARSERARALAELAGRDVELSTARHPSGLWRARVDGTVTRTGFDPDQAVERALLAALARGQLGHGDDATAVTAWTGTVPEERRVDEVASALGLAWREAALPPLVAADLTGIVLAPGHAG
ncbi:hypothetical protein HXP44_23305 [Streptomyces sioyaensis]|uniref:SioN n=1 Tax=Streptomyces sioyaensis TaxID=67364 RepID=C0JRW8_9ACTN|nr:hypothetical protein [Streptomyces sioyaensis]ACN80651.1 SioN [Streptomyces sioyaensis]MBM4794914.1 hypothetical protein [Streptomyces sioyaensis]RXS65593.1 hypothetical protein EST54_18005 [Streptomyces sioyaensis]